MQRDMITAMVILKIGGRTLTTKREIIMITEIKILRENDLSVPNQILNLNGDDGNCRLKLSTAKFIASAKPYEALRAVFDFIHQRVVKNMPGYAAWLLLSNSAWQPDTRIVKYLGLWGGLKSQGIEVPQGHSIMHTIERDGKLKFFGGVRVSDLSDGTILEAFLSERCSYVAIVPMDLDMKQALFNGWSGKLWEDLMLCEYVAEGNGLLMARVGEFDDLYNGVVGVGERHMLDKLLLALDHP
ncbi:hypothetical protein BK674_17985 [Pseudomonas moraviensis]|uniref:Uncharacterized protein n=2 Tax=Pseudomonas moraviensis TaxID=321662 RepID=A0A423NM90_9PSED|nr:hypothetical protein BK674_17985 [Pseudomonas moraviensis]